MKKHLWKSVATAVVITACTGFASVASAGNNHNSKPRVACAGLPGHHELTQALRASIYPTGGPENGGFELNMWASVVNRDGMVCEVAMSGNHRGDQWPGSRVISAQKANTANAFSLPGLALSTANLWAATQPGGSLFGLQHSNPVDTAVGYGSGRSHGGGTASKYGTSRDPMRGNYIGGVNVFGGGLALYSSHGVLLGGLGLSGDTSCADHNIAWRVRQELGLDNLPAGSNDAIEYDVLATFGHTACGLQEVSEAPAGAVKGPAGAVD